MELYLQEVHRKLLEELVMPERNSMHVQNCELELVGKQTFLGCSGKHPSQNLWVENRMNNEFILIKKEKKLYRKPNKRDRNGHRVLPNVGSYTTMV